MEIVDEELFCHDCNRLANTECVQLGHRREMQGQEARFAISKHASGYYCVSIPSYEGGEVVKAETYDALRNEVGRARAALEAITRIAGNLTDEAVEAVGGVNDAARQIAQSALGVNR